MITPENLPDYTNKENYVEFENLSPEQIEQSVEASYTALNSGGGVATQNEVDLNSIHRLSTGNPHGTVSSEISDFQTNVSANADVIANTAKISFPEAPVDGSQYVRKNATWETISVPPSGVLSVSGNSVDNTDSQNPIINDELSIADRNVLDEIETTGLTPQKTSFIAKSKNLFNASTATIGYFLNASGAPFASATYDASDFIEIEEGVQYYGRSAFNDMRFVTFYDAGQVAIPGEYLQNVSSFTGPVGAKYVRPSIYHTGLTTFQLEVGTAQTTYEPYGYFDGVNSVDSGLIYRKSFWFGKVWNTFGDSIDAQGKWQGYVAAQLFTSWVNSGIGGTRISDTDNNPDSMCRTERIAQLPNTVDGMLLIGGGSNDWAQSVPLGTVNDVVTTTYYGGWNTMMTNIYAKYAVFSQHPFIAKRTVPYANLPDKVTSESWPDAETNNQGLTTKDYAEADKIMCKKWGIACCDMSAIGINDVNKDYFFENDGGWIHPTQSTGGKRFARVVLGFMKALEPL